MILSLALRNLTRNRRRSLFTILAIAIGFIAINLFAGYILNVFSGLQTSAIRGESLGHLTLAKRGYFSHGSMDKEGYMFSGTELSALTQRLESRPGVVMAAPRISLNGLISNGEVSTIFIATAMIPAQQRILKDVGPEEVTPTVLPIDSEFEAIVAVDLANALGLEEGSNAVLFTSTLSGQANATDIQTYSLVNTGNAATNDKLVELSLSTARTLLDTEGAEKITLLLDDNSRLAEIRSSVLDDAAALGLDVEVRTWEELSAFYGQVRNMLSMIFLFIFSVVLVIVVMSIINTMSMTVMERTREIGTLRSLGVQRYMVRRIFALEGLLLALLACCLGAVSALLIAAVVNAAGISYIPPSNSAPVLLKLDVGPITLFASLSLLCLMSALFSLLPASKAANLPVTEALRHV